ncbi:cobalamin biosynthesis protein CobW [Drancourtella sp. An12]|uniref:CobW family GTP-binding protein n=1 Tax=Drancourtella sp. An12 TaxID=1965548 RepID=UPI000B365A66|nr:GTP-binding protein [Drancourtella sp. An12]OUQ46030.1 cobalamin biosynthesis protein CobW [Drancourtella sp. An12]
MTKVDIISGFLGAGKTTFIKRLVTDVFQGEKIVLIENEFGEIGIDGGFLKDAGIEITEMNSGCICCTLVGDFSEALKKVVDQYHPDRIIIEPSGVGKLSDVAGAVRNVEEHCGIELNSCITVADGKKVKIYLKNFGEFYSNQIEHAATIVLSRTQSMTDSKLKEAVALIREENPDAAIITTPWDQLDGEVIRNAVEQTSKPTDLLNEACLHHDHEGCCHHDHEDCGCHEHHHADDVFTSWGTETVEKYDRSEIEQFLDSLADEETYGTILRAKGIVEGTDGSWMEFDYVPGEYEIRDTKADYTGKICVIGTDIHTDNIQQTLHV